MPGDVSGGRPGERHGAPDGQRTSWVVFDYGEVICRHTDALPGMAARLGVDPAGFERAYWANRDAYDRGAADRVYWKAVGAAVGVDVDPATAEELTRRDIAGWSRVDPDTVGLLAELARSGTALALLSNAPASLARFVRQQSWVRHFRETVFSSDVGMTKPDAEIFALLLDRLGADPGDCVFFDDRAANVHAAHAAGLRAHVWPGPEHARTLLCR